MWKSIFEIGKRVVSGTGTIISYNKYEKIQFASEHIKKINSIDPTFVQSSGSSNLVLFYDIDLPEDKIIQRSPKIEEIFLRGSNLPSETKNSEIITDGLPTGKIIVEEVDNKNVLTNLYLVVKYRITNKNKSYSTNLEPIRIIEFSASEQPVQYNLSLHDITYNSVLVTFYIANISIDKKVNIEFYQGDNEIALGSIMIESPDPEKTEDKYVYKIVGLNEKTKYNLKMSINGSTPKNIGAMTTHSMDPISRTKEYIYIASIATLAVVIIVLMILLFVL